MTILSLGVIDVPYVEAESTRKQSTRLKKNRLKPKVTPSGDGASSTGDVAEILEAKYSIMSIFFERYQERIAEEFAEVIKGQMENVMMGAPEVSNPFAAIEDIIKNFFHLFLSSKEIESTGIPGVPTQAALDGVSHRFKHPYAKRGPRPSFIDTGLYENSFIAEVNE